MINLTAKVCVWVEEKNPKFEEPIHLPLHGKITVYVQNSKLVFQKCSFVQFSISNRMHVSKFQCDVIVISYAISKIQQEPMKTLLYLTSHNLWRWRHIEISHDDVTFSFQFWIECSFRNFKMTSSSQVMRYEVQQGFHGFFLVLWYRITCYDDVILKFWNEHSIWNWKLNKTTFRKKV